ncbi:MAG: sulfatase, partial [bacterium]
LAAAAARLLGRLLRIPGEASASAAAVFVVLFAVMLDYGHTAPFVRNPYRVFIALGIAAAAAGYVMQGRAVGRLGGRLTLMLPFALFAVMGSHWLFHYRAGAALTLPGVLIALGGIAAAAVLCVLAYRAYRARGWLVGAMMTGVVIAGVAVQWAQRPPVRHSTGQHAIPHVFLIVIDTLRADMLGCYDAAAPDTPNIDALASESVRFGHAISPSPWTLPSMASIMTGLPADVHGAVARNSILPGELMTLAERMNADGYLTGAVVDNAVLSARHGMDAGFDDFVHFPRDVRDTSFGTAILQRLFPAQYREISSTDFTTDTALEWVKRHTKDDFFLWLHIFDPHIAYEPPSRFQPPGTPPERIGRRFGDVKEIRLGILNTTPEEDAWIRSLYEGEVRYVDDAVGRFVKELRAEGIYDDALIVLTSDHGEEFREHGGIEHGHTLYNELLHVPLLIKLPGSKTGEVIDDVVSTQRVMRTVLDACGLGAGDDPGATAVGSLLNGGGGSESVVYSTGMMYHAPREAIILDGYKYIRTIESDDDELYDLGKDPAERVNIVNDRPDIASRARDVLQRRAAACARLREIYNIGETRRFELDDETIKRLKSLGYL